MVEIGNWMPFFLVLTMTSLWVSSMNSAPSEPISSSQVLEKTQFRNLLPSRPT